MIFIAILLLALTLSAQSVFEKATENKEAKKTFELTGYLRSTLFIGKIPNIDAAETKSVYGEASLKLKVRKMDFAEGFAEIRFRRGYEFGESLSEYNLREAYVDMHVGPFDIRAGHQIVVWGRADGFNPTNNITPLNMFIRSPEEDDRREGNFLIRSYYNAHPLRIETIWLPIYSPSIIPFKKITLPPGMFLKSPDYPNANLKDSAFAMKLHFELPSFDGSISYFNGYNPLPGINIAEAQSAINGIEIGLMPTAYKMHVVGADFSTTVGSFGLRGEIAYRNTCNNHEQFIYIPNPDIYYIIGGDKELGNFNIILQYIGRYVFDYAELHKSHALLDKLNYKLDLYNRMLSSQLSRISHAISFRPEWSLLFENLTVEILGLYNFTTKETYLKPKVSYDISDGLTFTMGGEYYKGPDETLFGLLSSPLSAIFIELKASF